MQRRGGWKFEMGREGYSLSFNKVPAVSDGEGGLLGDSEIGNNVTNSIVTGDHNVVVGLNKRVDVKRDRFGN